MRSEDRGLHDAKARDELNSWAGGLVGFSLLPGIGGVLGRGRGYQTYDVYTYFNTELKYSRTRIKTVINSLITGSFMSQCSQKVLGVELFRNSKKQHHPALFSRRFFPRLSPMLFSRVFPANRGRWGKLYGFVDMDTGSEAQILEMIREFRCVWDPKQQDYHKIKLRQDTFNQNCFQSCR